MNFKCAILLATLLATAYVSARAAETLPPLTGEKAPSNFDEMWAGFDPRAEPLDIEVIQEWEEDGVVLRIVRFHIGVFKGQPATLAAIFGFPKSATGGKAKIPGLVQIHGGGQYADYKACLLNAKRGYATVSIAWAGRISAPKYRVGPAEVKLFWDGKTDDPAYKLTTDWGDVDGYHAPGRNQGNAFPSAKAADWTLDKVESPRNSGWFLCALAARRALTFLEQQPEVDAKNLGVYGHSMGGKLTVMTAIDSRVKAAAPSCGGISDRYNKSPLFRATVGDDVSLQHVSCPIVFLSPANDFHGRIGDLPKSVGEINSKDWRVTCSPHHNHQDTAPHKVATLLWFDQHLKGEFDFPETPSSALELKTNDGVPVFTVQPDGTKEVRSVDIYYTQQGTLNEQPQDRENTMHRFWHSAKASETDGTWSAKLPIGSTDKPIWIFANVNYSLETPITGAGYYYEEYTTSEYSVSSLLKMASPTELQTARVRATQEPSLLIESFEDGWKKEWFNYKPNEWSRSTHKLYDDKWKAPANANATLILEVLAKEPNTLIVLIDGHAAEVALKGGDQWQQISLVPKDFRTLSGKPLANWKNIKQLRLSPAERLRPGRGEKVEPRIVGKVWSGTDPQFRNLRWSMAAPANSNSQTPILDVFPVSVANVVADRRGETSFSSQYSPSAQDTSSDLWADGLDESTVFHAEMKHRQDEANSFRLRMGSGGQIYSLRGEFGESVPPSWRAKGQQRSPWNDEVWQFVAVCTKYNGVEALLKAGELPEGSVAQFKSSVFKSHFFIHNSGAYIPGNAKLESLYCPLLASEVSASQRSVRMLNWGLIPQVNTVHRSPLLYYTQVRDVGDGIIELTWVVHNFSVRDDIVFDHLNAPWGGTRMSSLPFRYVSSPAGKLLEREDILNQSGVVPFEKTGGWILSSATEAEDSPSLALVFGRDRHLEAEQARKAAGEPYCQHSSSVYRDWRDNVGAYKNQWKDWRTRPANSFRNYDVCEVIPRLRIAPQTTIWFRSFLVVGVQSRVIEQAKSLVDKVDYGLLNFDPNTTLVSVSVPQEKGNKDSTPCSFGVFMRPVSGSMPLFDIQNTQTGQPIITTDPYYFVKKERIDLQVPAEHPHHDYYKESYGYSIDQNNSNWQSLLGFGLKQKPATGSWKQLSELVNPNVFPKASRHHLDLWVSAK